VTNLNDSGSGSFRAAAEAVGNRVVIFEISGYINLNSQIFITSPYITVAGQTAPSPGITLRNFGIEVMSHDVLIQHLRVRVGDEGPAFAANAGPDGILAYGNDAYNIVVDHCSISWVEGESSGTVSTPTPSNITYSRNIISESLNFSSKVPEESHGMVVYPGTTRFAAIQNLLAHNVGRNPEIHEGTETLFVNNIAYDCCHTDNIDYQPGLTLLFHGGRLANAPWRATIVGNSYIKGPTMPGGKAAIYTWAGDAGSQVYETDNRVDGVVPYANNMGFDPRVGSPPVSMSGITVQTSAEAEAFVLANAGARPVDRDAVDLRIVSEVRTRTGFHVSSQSQVGGWPTLAVNRRTLALPANPHSVRSSGYTVLEEWLHGYAAQVEGTVQANGAPPAPTNVRVLN
jgi:hypothetical protein